MSNITPFPKTLRSGERKRHEQAEHLERIRKQGGQAIQNLTSWRRGIPTNDRERLARNMDAIIQDYQIDPAKLDWQPDYTTVEDFRRDVHRMRLPETAAAGRTLIATPSKWTQLLRYINEYVQERGESVSLESLADRLIRGTRFHPTRKEQTKSEKILYLLGLWANKLSEDKGLLSTYKNIAKARAEYYDKHRYGIHSRDKKPEFDPESLNSKLSDEYTEPSDEFSEFFNKKFRNYSQDDWKTLYELIPDDCGRHNHYRYIQGEITDWMNNYSEKGTLYSFNFNGPVLCWGEDIPFLPHWFIGYCDEAKLNIIADTSDHWLGKIIREQGTIDPVSLGQEIDWDLGGGYLVLYPDAGLNRIIPYVYFLDAEGSEFDTLDQSQCLESWRFFQPKGVGETTVSLPFLGRVEESMNEIYRSWETTSCKLKSHPYLIWKEDQEETVDREIEAMLVRTGHKKIKK